MSTPGYSGKSLPDKLGLKPGMKIQLVNPPDDYMDWVGSLEKVKSPPWDFVHVFTNATAELEINLAALRKQLSPSGMVWISWYKRSSGLSTEISENTIRDTALPLGFVDVKVCAVSDEWSGLKLVIRKGLRV